MDTNVASTGKSVDPLGQTSLRLAATLLLTGQLLYIVVTQLHADGQANNHPAVFAEYASSQPWKAVHAGQFGCAAILLAGLVALALDLDGLAARGRWPSRFGAASAVVALALYGVLQAIDGVGNQQVDAAWVGAPASERAARFASAESMRWLEWGARSYFDYALRIALLLVAAAAVLTVGFSRGVACLMGLSGLAYLAQGWVVGSEGFSGTHTTLILVAWGLSLGWMIWLVIVAWRHSAEPKPTAPSLAHPQP